MPSGIAADTNLPPLQSYPTGHMYTLCTYSFLDTLNDTYTQGPRLRPLLGDFFIPAFQCPYRVERIGTLGDGGKWVCGVDRVAKQDKCVIYSFGSSPLSSSSTGSDVDRVI